MQKTKLGYALPFTKHILLVLLIVSCFQSYGQSKKKINKEMNVWYGKSLQQLIMNYGPASRIESDGADGKIAVFSNILSRSGTTLNTDAKGGLYTTQNPYQVYKHRMFFINKNNEVYHWLYESNYVPPQQLQLNINGNINHNVYR